MSLFTVFRGRYGFAYYDSVRSAVSVDKTLAAVVYMCILLYVATIFATIGSRRKSRYRSFFSLTFNFTVIMIILVCLCGYGWKDGFIDTQTTYIDYSEEKIDAKIGISFSLNSVNMTLKGVIGQNSSVYYNERLYLFDADELQRQERNLFHRGLPSPILTLCNYMCFEGSELMWGRYFRTSGYYAYILLCSTLTFWIITVILMCSVVFYGSVMFLVSGLTMCITVIVYHLLQPPFPIKIPFGGEVLEISYGWCFYLLLTTGIIISVIGSLFVTLNAIDPQILHCLFGFDKEGVVEEIYNVDGCQQKNKLNGNTNLGYNPEIKEYGSRQKQMCEPNLNMQNENMIIHPSTSNNISPSNSLEKNKNNLQEILNEETEFNNKLNSNEDLSHIVVVSENQRL